jgi:crotonobetainyl-CoA:carnitine CoA-transferase CaiB-like acyl-CoA transferase
MSPSIKASKGPLAGRTILDCSVLLPGPFIGKLLADRGARVLKIENPDRPDPARGMGAAYADLNEHKELVWLNLTRDEDRAKFRALTAAADGLIEGFRPVAKKKLGLDEPSLHAVNPKLCIASLVGYPEDGPWRDRAGHDLNFQAVSGVLTMFNEIPGLPLADLFAAYNGALAMAALLDQAARTGRGARIAVSMSETLTEVQSLWIREFREHGREPRHGTTLMSGKYPCYRIYHARDGRPVAVGAVEDKFWRKTCEILGVTELAPKGYATGEEGRDVAARIQAAFAARDWAEWAPLFDAADCCVEPVRSYLEVYGV